MTTKRCSRCKQDLPAERFSRSSASKDGLQPKCKACAKAYRDARLEKIRENNRIYRERNREAIRVKQREAYRRDPSKVLEANRAWRARNLEHAREHARRYYAENRQERLAYQKQWASENRDKRRQYCRKYYAAHPEVHRVLVMRLRAAQFEALTTEFSVDQIFARMAYFGFKCWMCRGSFEHIDHIKPLSKGGPHLIANLRPSCASCNAKKSNSWPVSTAVDWS